MSGFRLDFPFSLKDIDLFYDSVTKTLDKEYLDKLKQTCLVKDDSVVMLGLGISTSCNLNCAMCYYHDNNALKRHNFLKTYELNNFLIDIHNISHVMIALEGEPLIHPNFIDILKEVYTKCPNITVVSNGNFLPLSTLEYLAKIKLCNLVFSTEAGEKFLYERLRVNGKFDIFCKNVSNATKYLQKVQFHVVVSNQNIAYLEEILYLGAKLKISEISFAQLRECPSSKQHKLQRASSTDLIKIFDKLIYLAKKLQILITIPITFDKKIIISQWLDKQHDYFKILGDPSSPCPYLYNYCNILSNGDIFPCCGDMQPITPALHNFNDIFNNEYIVKLRILHKLNLLPDVCLNCLNLK